MDGRDSRSSTGRGPGDGWFLTGYAGLAGFLFLEALVRRRGRPSDLRRSTDTGGTTTEVAVTYAGVALLAPLARRLGGRRRLPVGPPTGLVLQGAGLALRLWAMRTLDDAYSRTVHVTEGQSVIESGPYRVVRHPGYLGSLLVWAGFGLTSGSAPVLALTVLVLPPYLRRIEAEELLLARCLPGYGDYAQRTGKLVPRLSWSEGGLLSRSGR